MNYEKTAAFASANRSREGRISLVLLIVASGIVALSLAAILHFRSTSSERQATEQGDTSATGERQAPSAREDSQPETAAARQGPGSEKDVPPIPGTPQGSTLVNPASSAEAEQAIARLSQLDPTKPLSAEQAAFVKQDLQKLIAEGAGAIPAIRQLLKQDLDLKFDQADSKLIGSPTLRTALIDSLHQIGSPEATDLSHEILGGTVDPLEVAKLARNLEEKAPGQYREEELAAARNSLELAAGGQLKGRDISPLFEMFHAFGDETAVALMQQIAERGKWLNYLPYVMAEVPESAGIGALTELLNNPSVMAKDQDNAVLRSIAVAAITSPEAATTLADRARQNQIPDAAWSRVAAALSGDSYQPFPGNVFTNGTPQTALTSEQVSQRLALIDQLSAATTSQVARDALTQARARLSAKAPRGP